MRRVVLIVLAIALMQPALAVGQVAESLREQARVRESLLVKQLQDLGEMREELREIWTRLEQQTGGMLRAQQQGESVESLRLRDTDLRKAETELLATLLETQQKRSSMLENRTMIASIELEVQRLSAEIGGPDAPLSGAWRIAVEPDQEGVAYLQQQGTLVSGTYSLSGGFTGSFRGTFVAGKVRLERIDSQFGFAAIYYGRLVGRGRNARLQGNWEATQLASGLPSRGTWTARRLVEEE
jgi:hypothetical protein